MTENEAIRSDYFDANYGQLLAVAGRAERLLFDGNFERVVVEQEDPHDESRIVSGGLTATDMQVIFEASGTTMSPEEVEEAARFQNRVQLGMAQADFVTLQAKASMTFVAEQADAGLLDEATQPALLNYAQAERHAVYPDDNLTVVVTKLHDMEQLGEVVEYSLKVTDNPVDHYLTMDMVGNRFTSVQAGVRPSEDADYKRWGQALGPTINELTPILVGIFESEDELDGILSNIWLRFVGSAQEEIMAPLLDEVRTRAMTARANRELNYQYDPNASLPTVDKLDEWDQRLASLYS